MHRFLLSLIFSTTALAQPFLVENGQPRAEIVIAEKPTRMQRVAAHEFRQQIEKISGAKLPIVTQPSGKAVKVFIGASTSCPVKADGLKDGAYRIASGADWLALIGDDADFAPVGPFARGNSDIPRAQAEWEKILGAPYGLPIRGLYKHRSKITLDGETLDVWGLDERGSFNAVSAFLQKLGARWYLPGELGEVLPTMKTIELPKLDETVKPDFALRQFNFRFATCGPDTAQWVMRLGIRNDQRLQIAHGMANMTNRDEVFAQHPEWFAIYGGKPDFKPGDSKCQLCYSNDELFRETVRYARALLDTFQLESVSIMPPDGYTSICQCEKCQGKDSPERNERGLLSDYVWDFVNRVAKEVGKTHPHAKVLNCAYGSYTLPPLKIDQLEPNVLVCIVGGRRPISKASTKTEGEAAPEALQAAWAKKTKNPLFIFENYPFTDRGWYLPAFAGHALGDSVKATKGLSRGEDVWLSVRQDFDKVATGFNHFLVYFTARAYWPGYEPAAALQEYCRLFYGPARGSENAKLDLQYDTATGAGWGIAASKGITAGRKGYKASLFEGGINVPFIARWPGKVPAGKSDNASLISAVDLLPTFCELAGATLPDGYKPDGISQVEALKGKSSATRTKPLFWKMGSGKDSEFHWANYAVVDQQWKLLTTTDGKRLELYDIAADPLEAKDLATEKPEIVMELITKLDAWKATLPEKPSGEVFSAERTK